MSATMDDAELEHSNVLSLAEERVLYILDWPSQEEEDGQKEVMAFVVMKRVGGLLLALPEGVLPAEDLQRANAAEVGGSVLGPSTTLVVSGVVSDGGVDAATGATMNVLVVDMDASVLSQMRVAGDVEDLAVAFDPDDRFAIPSPDELLARSLEWMSSSGLQALEANYTPEVTAAEAEEEVPLLAAVPKRQRRKPPGGATVTGDGGPPKRATTATLAASMETVLQTLPVLTAQMQQLLTRQEEGVSSASVLSQPLGGRVAASPSVTLGAVAKVVKAPPRMGPPPKKGSVQVQHVPGAQQEAEELVLDKQEVTESSKLAEAMMAQSVAITSLVAQIAGSSGDPMMDLQGQSSSTRGALGWGGRSCNRS